MSSLRANERAAGHDGRETAYLQVSSVISPLTSWVLIFCLLGEGAIRQRENPVTVVVYQLKP
jgi:hypothetical protein